MERLNLIDFDQKANELLDAARKQAAEILERAQNAANQIAEDESKRARAEGFAKGYLEGKEKAEQESKAYLERKVREMSETYKAILGEIRERIYVFNEQIYGETVSLATQIAGKVVEIKAADDHTTVLSSIKRCIDLIIAKTFLTIRVNAKDFENSQMLIPELQHQFPGINISVVADNSIPAGGCAVATENAGANLFPQEEIRKIAAVLAGKVQR